MVDASLRQCGYLDRLVRNSAVDGSLSKVGFVAIVDTAGVLAHLGQAPHALWGVFNRFVPPPSQYPTALS